MPHPRHVPHIANAVLLVAFGASAALLLGAPAEKVLALRENPVSRVAVVTFGMALIGILGLAFALHLLLHRHKRMEQELAEMRALVQKSLGATDALAASADALEDRLDGSVRRMQDEMAAERERMRNQVRAYVRPPNGGVRP